MFKLGLPKVCSTLRSDVSLYLLSSLGWKGKTYTPKRGMKEMEQPLEEATEN